MKCLQLFGAFQEESCIRNANQFPTIGAEIVEIGFRCVEIFESRLRNWRHRSPESQVEGVHRFHHDEKDYCGDQYERDQGGNEGAPTEDAAIDREGICREIRGATENTDDRHHDVVDQRGDYYTEGAADNNGDREINDVSTHQKIAKFFEHIFLSLSSTGKRHFGVAEESISVDCLFTPKKPSIQYQNENRTAIKTRSMRENRQNNQPGPLLCLLSVLGHDDYSDSGVALPVGRSNVEKAALTSRFAGISPRDAIHAA